jgi:hypothetical protein
MTRTVIICRWCYHNRTGFENVELSSQEALRRSPRGAARPQSADSPTSPRSQPSTAGGRSSATGGTHLPGHLPEPLTPAEPGRSEREYYATYINAQLAGDPELTDRLPLTVGDREQLVAACRDGVLLWCVTGPKFTSEKGPILVTCLSCCAGECHTDTHTRETERGGWSEGVLRHLPQWPAGCGPRARRLPAPDCRGPRTTCGSVQGRGISVMRPGA